MEGSNPPQFEGQVGSGCEDILPLADFFDPELAKGAGAYGRVCMKCRVATAIPSCAQ